LLDGQKMSKRAVKEIDTDVQYLLRKVKDLECCLKKVQDEKITLEKRVAELEKKDNQGNVETMIKETLKSKSYADMIKKDLVGQGGKIVTISQVTNLQERQKNIIIRGVKEVVAESWEERNRYDKENVKRVAKIAGLDNDMVEKSILSCRRLGKRETEKDGEKVLNEYRPLLVRVSSPQMREDALRSNGNLRQHNRQEGTRFRIEADLTKEQREKLEKTWEIARKKNEESKEAKNGLVFFVIGQENPVIRSRKMTQEIVEA